MELRERAYHYIDDVKKQEKRRKNGKKDSPNIMLGLDTIALLCIMLTILLSLTF